jgi:hypothetical protein
MASGNPMRSPTDPQAAPRKRGRPILNDAALKYPRFAALREKQRMRKRKQRARKKEQTRLELAEQAILVEQAISVPTEAADQAVLTEQATSVTTEVAEQVVQAKQATSIPDTVQQVQRYPIYTIVSIPPQPVLAKQATGVPAKAQRHQLYPIYTIISIPPRPSSNTTSLAAIPEDGPAPAMPEGTHIQGFGRLPKTGYPQTEVAIALLSLTIQNPPRGLG